MPDVEHTFHAFMDDPDADKPNPIHSTATARAHGFSGALVGGVTAYGWTVRTIVAALGEGWLDDGWVHLRFRAPVYPGDALAVRVAGGELSVGNANGVCFAGEVGRGAAPWSDTLSPTAYTPGAPELAARPALTLAAAPVGQTLRPMDTRLSVHEALAFARDAERETVPALLAEPPALHPAWIAERMIRWLHHSYDYGPAIHTESHIQHLRRAHAGRTFTVTGRCVAAYERKGHHYIVNDGVLWQAPAAGAAAAEVARLKHTAIFRLRGA